MPAEPLVTTGLLDEDDMSSDSATRGSTQQAIKSYVDDQPRSFSIAVFDSATDCATGNGVIAFCVPASMASMDITDVVATAHTAGTTGTMDVQVRRRRVTTDADVLSTKLTIDSTEVSSITAAAAHVINASNDDLNEGDLIYIDVDAVQTTEAKGLTVTITAAVP